jgi:hypothetical protein
VATDLDIQYGRLGWVWEPLGIPRVLKFGEASGLPAGDLGHIVDAEAGVHDGGDFAKLRLSGPFVGVSLRF